MHDARWYGEVMTEEGSPAMLPLDESPWLPLYLEAARLIDPHEHVVDLGCGTGRFIQQLYNRGHYAPIVGVDWAAAVLEEAVRYCMPLEEDAPLPTFLLADLVGEWKPDVDRAGNTVYTCFETLEHLPADLDVVARIPPGHRFIFSVPNYWSASHERWFPNVGDVFRRYEELLAMRRWIYVPIDWPTKMLHLVEGRRRSDTWD